MVSIVMNHTYRFIVSQCEITIVWKFIKVHLQRSYKVLHNFFLKHKHDLWIRLKMTWTIKRIGFSLCDWLWLQAVLVPTVETVRLQYFMDMLLESSQPLMLVGGAGTGKSAVVRNFLERLPESFMTTNVPLNFYTTASVLKSECESIQFFTFLYWDLLLICIEQHLLVVHMLKFSSYVWSLWCAQFRILQTNCLKLLNTSWLANLKKKLNELIIKESSLY